MPASSTSKPSLEESLGLLTAGFDRDAMLTLVGECDVEYEGRASSYLPFGERLVILKPDGTLLVHGNEGHEPINWQRSGSVLRATLEEGRLLVEAHDTRDDETVVIQFAKVAQISTLTLTDHSDLELTGSEEDLRNRIFERPELVEAGFEPQIRERETDAGPVDIFGYDRDRIPTVVELKRKGVGLSAVRQLDGYVEALSHEFPVGQGVRGILVAPSVSDRAERLAERSGYTVVSIAPDQFS